MGVAVITGVTGQLGYYLAERLVAEGNRVIGIVRRPIERGALPCETALVDLTDDFALFDLLGDAKPDEFYHCAAQTSSPASWVNALATVEQNGTSTVRLLSVLRRVAPACRFLQAGSSELFRGCAESPQNECTPLAPRNPYGFAKALAHFSVQTYRERFGTFAANAILFPHESPRRPHDFVFRKVIRAVAEIHAGRRTSLRLGNLAAKRDWGYTADYADAAIRILRAPKASDYVVASGECHSVEALVRTSFALIGRDFESHVERDATLTRDEESVVFVGDTRRLREELGWRPTVTFQGLIERLLDAELSSLGLTR